jgi:hypothetical protein
VQRAAKPEALGECLSGGIEDLRSKIEDLAIFDLQSTDLQFLPLPFVKSVE